MSTDVRLYDHGYNTSIKWTFVGNRGKKTKKETWMRKEEEKIQINVRHWHVMMMISMAVSIG